MFRFFDCLETVTSTNDYLQQFVSDGIARAVVALEQTGGKGQYGRRWESPKGQGLYLSFLIYPPWDAGYARFLSQIASLSVIDAIVHYGGRQLPLVFKTPNDVLIGEKKVAGILIELGTCGKEIQWAIIGMGVNLLQRRFPDHLQTATSLWREGVQVASITAFCDTLNEAFQNQYRRATAGNWKAIEDDYHNFFNRKSR